MKHKIKKDQSSNLSLSDREFIQSSLIPQFKQRGSNKFLEENEYKSQKLSEEEVKKHLIKEDLNELQRCKVLLKKQDPDQQFYKMIEKGSEELQLEAGQAFVELLKQDIIIEKESHLRSLFELSKKMLKLWSDENLLQWKKVFYLSLKILDDQLLLHQALSLILSLTDKSQPLASRKAATYLMGKIIFIFKTGENQLRQINNGISNHSSEYQQWITKFKVISQDVNWEIRSQAAQAMKFIYKDESKQQIQNQLLTEFEELLDDEEEEVQCHAIDTIKFAAQHCSRDRVQTTLLQKMRRLLSSHDCGRQKVDEKLLDSSGEILDAFTSRGLGCDFTHLLASYLQQMLLNSSSKRSTLESEKEFYNYLLMSFCFNLPAISLHMDVHSFREYIMPIVVDIQNVKESLYNFIVSLPLVILNVKSDELRVMLLRILHTQLETAVKEKELMVLSLVVKEIHILYEEYHKSSTRQEYSDSNQVFNIVKKQIVASQSIIDKDWRNYEHYLNFIKKVHSCMDSQNFSKNFLQSLLKNLKKQNHHNKNLIIDLLIQILTSPCHSSTRSDIHQFLIFDIAASKSSLDRASFAYFCRSICLKISKKYFQEIFLDSFINLLDDKQVAVQVALVKSIKEIRYKVEDVLQINKLENYLNSIKSDSTKKQFIRELAEQEFEILQSQDYKESLGGIERQKEDLNLAVQEMQIYQKEREQSEIDKKRDVDRVMKQAKDAYFNKINQSFTFSKPSLLGAGQSNQSARQGSATVNPQQNEYVMHKRRSNNLQQIKTAYQVQDMPRPSNLQQQTSTSTNTQRKRSSHPLGMGLGMGLTSQSTNNSRTHFFNNKEESKRDSSADHLAMASSNSVVTNANTNNFNFQSLFPPINRYQNMNSENTRSSSNQVRTLTITSGESQMKSNSNNSGLQGGSHSATNHYSHNVGGSNGGGGGLRGEHGNVLSSRNLSKPHSGLNVSNTSILMGGIGPSSLSNGGRNSYIQSSGHGNNNFSEGISSLGLGGGSDFSSGQGMSLQNQKNLIPLHPSSLKNRPGRKIDAIQTAKPPTNYKNISVSPLLNPKKQFEAKKI